MQPEFRRGAKRQESRRLGVQRRRADSLFGQALEVRATAANIQEHVAADMLEDCALSFGKFGGQPGHCHPRVCNTGILRHVLLRSSSQE